MASSSPRAKRKRTKKQPSMSSSSGSSEESSAPTYVVEEDSRGELVNRRMGVAWPTRVHEVKRYPDHSSAFSPVATSTTDDDEERFANSPYEMISIAELDTAAAAVAGLERRAARGRKARGGSSERSASSSPQYVSLSSRTSRMSGESSGDESTARIDSVVFETAEELARYQRLFRAASARASRSDISASDFRSATSVNERDETDGHYIGVKSRRAVDKKLTPGAFFMYHDKPSGGEMPVSIELKLGHMSSTSKTYHFPILRFESDGEPYYAVMQTDTDVKMFPSIVSLVQHYSANSNEDPGPSRLEPRGLPV